MRTLADLVFVPSDASPGVSYPVKQNSPEGLGPRKRLGTRWSHAAVGTVSASEPPAGPWAHPRRFWISKLGLGSEMTFKKSCTANSVDKPFFCRKTEVCRWDGVGVAL